MDLNELGQRVERLERENRRLKSLIESTQPRVARLERGDASLDMLTRTLVSLGGTRKELGKAIAV